jgi:archaellum component FlaC
MELKKQHLLQISECLQELAEEAKEQGTITHTNIRKTNRVVYSFIAIGAICAFITFFHFYWLTKGVNSSVESMHILKDQMTDMRASMENIAFDVDNMGQHVGYLGLMNNKMFTITRSVDETTQQVKLLKQSTAMISQDSHLITQNTHLINQYFGRVNYSIDHVSKNLGEVAEPINQFFPFP